MDEHMGINFDIESSAMHRKLQSKNDALKIMRTELEKYRSERDQFKLMAETLQLRYSAIKNSLTTCEQGAAFSTYGVSNVGVMLNECRGRNMTLQTEVEALRQKVTDLQGDIKCLRKKTSEPKDVKPRARKKSSDPVDKSAAEKSNLIAQMEAIKKKNAQLQYDFRSLLDEKEEVVTERDAYKCKAHRLNHELNVVLQQSDKSQAKFIDIDALILENKYLQERIGNFETEVELLKQSAAKYKSMLEVKKKPGNIKFGNGNDRDKIMSHKQVRALLENGTVEDLPLHAATIADLKSLCLTLLENLNDKSLALTHQKKINKLLATKIADLEQKLQICAGGSPAILSPSQVLLNGYTSSNVDASKELKLPRPDTNDTSEMTVGESSKSQFSSELEEICTSDLSSECAKPADTDERSYTELEDLPPAIAKLVAESLREDSLCK